MNNSVYSSTDKGVTWTQAGNAPRPACLAVNSLGHIFAGTFSNGMFRSTDRGVSWIPINYGSNMSRIDGIAFDTLGHVFAYHNSVYRSTDNGNTWAQIKRGLPETIIRSILPAQSLFVGTLSSGVFRRNEILTWAPLPPIQLAPPNASTDIPVNPILKWNSSIHAASYALFVARDSNFSQVVYSNGGITDTSVQVFGLPYTTTLWWRLRGTHPEEGDGGWSTKWNFTTTFPLLAPPQAVSPVNGELNTAINPMLVWRKVTSALAYSVQVATDSIFSNILFESTNIADTSVRAAGLQYAATYFWRTRTIRSDSTSAWSSPWHFTTAIEGTSGHFPLNIGNSWSVVQKLYSEPQWYYLMRIEKDTIQADGRQYAAIRTYSRPATGTTWIPGGWNYLRTAGAQVYMYPDSILVDFDSTVGSCLPGPFPPRCVVADYWWSWLGRYSRIVSISNNNGYDFWSYVDSMGFGSIHETLFQNYFPICTIGARINGVEYGIILAVEEYEPGSLPQAYVLFQNYPNPFNPSTTIKFQIPGSTFVTLKVFDLLGREVATLVNEEMQPGRYEKLFHAQGLASGMYLYQLKAGSFVETKKLLLLR